MQPWFIPMFYVSGAVLGGLALPRIEQAYLSAYTLGVSVASAQALLSAAASGMMALTGIVFAMAFVMVQFSAIAYSPRLVLWFARDRTLFHALGAFTATFIYALFTLAWVDRGASGKVPLLSMLLVGIMIIVSMLAFSKLMQRLGDLQIGNVLQLVGDQGRGVIADMFRRLDAATAAPRASEAIAGRTPLGPLTQTVKYFGKPRTVARFDVDSLVAAARQARGTIVMACAVGDTLVEGDVLLRVHRAGMQLPEERAPALRPSRQGTNLRAGPKISDPASRRHRHQGAVAGDQRPNDRSPDDRSARGPAASPRLGRARRRPCRGRKRRSSACVSDAELGGLSDARVRRDPTLRLGFGSSDAADEVRSRWPCGLAAESKSGWRRCEATSSTSTVSSEPHRSTSRTRGWRGRKTGRASACLGESDAT